jgi:NAD(P)-dependent dehydrogenase (short-subunit alcohol dehydrogenase family)
VSSRRIAIVTGAGSGINRATAKLLGEEYDIALFDLNGDSADEAAAEINDAGGRARGYGVDVTDRGAVFAAVDAVAAEFGGVDILVNGAGYVTYVPFLELSEDELDRMLAVHVKGTTFCTQAALPHMREAGWGRIVNTASIAAFSTQSDVSHYSAAKAAVIGLTKGLTREIGPWGVTINAIAPGAIETPLLQGIPDFAYKRAANTALGRVGTPEECAHTIRFLVSEEAGFITGWVIGLAGGAYT